MTLPSAANVLTLDGRGAKNVVVDTGANYVRIGKKQAERMGITNVDLAASIPYLTADGSTARCTGVTKKTVAIRLLPGTVNEAHVHILVDNAETYDVLLGSHFVNRVVNSINLRQI